VKDSSATKNIIITKECKMSKPQPPKKPKQIQQTTQTSQRDYLPTWCKGIMGGCVNCGGCV